jgi:hypothetical protein
LADKDADMEDVLDIAAAFWDNLDLDHVFDFESVAATIRMEQVAVWLAEDLDLVVGGVGVLITPWLWNHRVMYMEELFLWAYDYAPKTTALRLMRHVMRIADDSMGRVTFHAMRTSPDKLENVYGRFGLKPEQRSFTKEYVT